MEMALSGMPPLYIGWNERDMDTLEKLLAVYSTSLDLPATFQKDCFTIHRCLIAENRLHMAKKRDKYHFLIGPGQWKNTSRHRVVRCARVR